jgi:rfaE bifunctional protein nucleotidyltransferase chain/domain
MISGNRPKTKLETHNTAQKIKSQDELAKLIQKVKAEGRKVVQCHGVFDLLHPGHIRHFEAARREGDILIVTITQDEFVGKGPGHPVFNQQLRAESLAALQCVDYVAIHPGPVAVEAIKKLKPDVFVKGNEYAIKDNDLTGKISDEEDAVCSVGGRIHFTDGITFSSSKLLNSHFHVYPEEAEEYLEDFRKRYVAADIIDRLRNLNKLKVLVIGDTIIDQYHYCSVMGKSPKANMIAAKFLREESFGGGVLAAANHVAGFCGQVHLVTCLGLQDSREEFARNHLKLNVTPKFFYREDAPTVVKRRFIDPSFLSKMFEVCFIEDMPLPPQLSEEICTYLEKVTSEYDLVLVADFGHGFIDREMINIICSKSNFLAVNAQTNSANSGFNLITKYHRADYICIDEPEIRLAAHDQFGDLKDLIMSITQQLRCDRIIVTRGHRGSLSFSEEEGFYEAPVFSKNVVDTVGAGDAYLSVTAPCVAAGFPMPVVGFVGNAVGAMAVLIVGNRSSVEPVPLFKFITALLK